MLWLVLAFLSATLLGFYDVFKKLSLKENAVLPVLFLNTFISTLIFAPFILSSYLGWLSPTSIFYVPPTTLSTQGYILLKSMLVLSSWIFGYIGMKHLPLTIVGPINATRPVLVLIGAMLVYGEQLNALQWLGVALAICSFFLLSRSGKKEGIDFKHNKWIYAIALTALLGACSGLYDKYLMAPVEQGGLGQDKMAVQSWYNLYQCLLMAIVTIVLWFPKRNTTQPFQWRWTIVMISVFLCAADFAYFYALSKPEAMISIVSMVRRGSVLVSFLFGAFIFQEKNLKHKALDLALVLLGMICLYFGTKG